jgi:hypothetical protein
MVQYKDDGSGQVEKFKGWIYQPKKRKRKGVVQIEELSLDDFNGQGARDAVAGEEKTIKYQVDENGKKI